MPNFKIFLDLPAFDFFFKSAIRSSEKFSKMADSDFVTCDQLPTAEEQNLPESNKGEQADIEGTFHQERYLKSNFYF